MSITTETNRLAFVGDGVDNSPYAISFPLIDTGSVGVRYVTGSTGVEVLKVIVTDYTIAIAADNQTATLTLVTTAPATGETLLITREDPPTRLSSYSNFDGQPSRTLNSDFDLGALVDQTLQEQLDRTIRVSKGQPLADLPLTPLTLKGNASKFVGVKSDETDFELVTFAIADGTIAPAKLLDGTVDNQLIQYDSGAAEWKYETDITIPGTLTVNGNDLMVTAAIVGANVRVLCQNTDNTNASSDASIAVRTGGASGGDPHVLYNVGGVTQYVTGIDNSDADKWVLSRGSAIGTTNVIEITQAGAFTLKSTLTVDGTLASGALTVTGLMQSTTAGVGIARTDGTLHVHKATAGSISANPFANLGVFEDSTENGISILVPDGNNANFYFGSPSKDFGASLVYNFSGAVVSMNTHLASGIIKLKTANNVLAMTIDASQNVTIVGDLAVNGGDITSTSGAIAFGNENLSTTGTLASGALTVTGAISCTTTLTVDTTSQLTGDVKIGTVGTPDTMLHLEEAAGAAVAFKMENSEGFVELRADGAQVILNINDTTDTEELFRSNQTLMTFNLNGDDRDIRFEGTVDANMAYFNAGQNGVGFGTNNPAAKIAGDQNNVTGNIPVLRLIQADVSEEFIRFQGSAASAVLTQSIVDEGDVTTATRQGFLKAHVIDDGNQITDQDYFIPIFTLA